jgi:hypothetical protein
MAGLRPLGEEGKNMRVRILMALSVALLLSVGLATAAAAKKQPFAASQQLCTSHNGLFSTKGNSSFYAPLSKQERLLWTCNSYSGSTAGQALAQSCASDGGPTARSDAPGYVTCWKN